MYSTDFAYWVGVVQTDGYFKKLIINGIERYWICLDVGYKSLPMLKKFQKISQKIFNIKGSIWHNKKRNTTEFIFGAKLLLGLFNEYCIGFSDPPKPPSWIIENDAYFGAYLAGVIDGDGDVRIKRPLYPQCAVRVTSGHFANELREAIKNKLKTGVSKMVYRNSSFYQGRKIEGTSYRIEFYVSSKNFNYFNKFILDHMTLDYKRSMVFMFIMDNMNFPERFKKPN